MSATCDKNETVIVVRPARMGGQPTVGHSRLTAELVAAVYYQHGLDEVFALWDDLDRDDVAIACWYQARYGSRTWRNRWKDWLEDADPLLWSSDEVPLPETKNPL